MRIVSPGEFRGWPAFPFAYGMLTMLSCFCIISACGGTPDHIINGRYFIAEHGNVREISRTTYYFLHCVYLLGIVSWGIFGLSFVLLAVNYRRDGKLYKQGEDHSLLIDRTLKIALVLFIALIFLDPMLYGDPYLVTPD